MTTRRTMMTGVAAIGTGSVASRLARLERTLSHERPRDGDALVLVFEHPDGSREATGRIGRDTTVAVIGVRPDGPG
jgi:hypothetical protein